MITILRRLFTAPADPIDALIEANRAKPLPGMREADWTKIDEAGARRWQEAQRGQLRYQEGPRVEKAS